MGKVISLHAERWIEGVAEFGDLSVAVSSKGRVRFTISSHELNTVLQQTLSMQEMADLGEALSVAYRKEDDSV